MDLIVRLGCAAGQERKRGVADGWQDWYTTELTEVVCRKVGLSRSEAAGLVEQVLEEIGDTLARGEDVKLPSFGPFLVRSKGERLGRNPKTGVEVPIGKRRVLMFKPSLVLKAHINGEASNGEERAALKLSPALWLLPRLYGEPPRITRREGCLTKLKGLAPTIGFPESGSPQIIPWL